MSTNALKKQEIDVWLDEVNYAWLNSPDYLPSEFSLMFMNFIKLVNGSTGESHKTPPVHLAMMDKVATGGSYIANLCFRGAAKTTLFIEYLCLFVAVFSYLPGLGKLDGMIYVSDSMENGVASARKNIEFRYNNSEFLQEWLPEARFTDKYIEFKNREGHRLGIKMFGAKALALDTLLFTPTGTTTIGDCQIGDTIMGADGLPTVITEKSEIFHKPMYRLGLADGRSLRVSEDHLNQVWIKTFHRNLAKPPVWEEKTLSTNELLALNLHQETVRKPDAYSRGGTTRRPLVWIENCAPVRFPERILPLDPYVVGLLLGDGCISPKASGLNAARLVGHKDDWQTYYQEIPYPLGKPQVDKRNYNVVTHTIRGLRLTLEQLNMFSHGDRKEIPHEYLFGSVEQRLALLQGLMDTDGTVSPVGKTSFTSNSLRLCEGLASLVRSLGGTATIRKSSAKASSVHIKLNMVMFRLPRKADRQRFNKKNMVAVRSIDRIDDQASQCIAVDNDERQFIADDFVRTHNTGIRGTKIFGKRPKLAVLDDLVSDDDSKSQAAMLAIRDTVYKGINHALDPTSRKVIFNGTPFGKEDILVQAVESGAWDVNVWPVCEKFPCSKEEFVGAWEDRFSYEYVKEQYELSVLNGQLSAFLQELMLRITSEEERLVQETDIRWYSRDKLLANKGAFNFYITSDTTTSKKNTADFANISVWAYNANGDWFWVDGIHARQTIDKTWNDLFRLVSEYKPQAVGIEVTGQQQAYIKWLQAEMLARNIWFNFASSEKSGEPGIRPTVDKLSRFNNVVPWFKAGKIYFPEEWKLSQIMGYCMGQIRLVTQSGIKGKDDFIDSISMLGYLTPWKPSDTPAVTQHDPHWDEEQQETSSALKSYIV